MLRGMRSPVAGVLPPLGVGGVASGGDLVQARVQGADRQSLMRHLKLGALMNEPRRLLVGHQLEEQGDELVPGARRRPPFDRAAEWLGRAAIVPALARLHHDLGALVIRIRLSSALTSAGISGSRRKASQITACTRSSISWKPARKRFSGRMTSET